MRFLPLWVFVGTLFGSTLPVHASNIDDLIHTLKKNRSYKVRLTAVLGISKYSTPKAINALRAALRRRREHSYVRGFAALSLGRMKVQAAIPDILKASRARSRFLRRKAYRALRMLCPRKVLRRKKFYISLSKVRVTGPFSQFAKNEMLKKVHAFLSKRRDITTIWYRCRKPKRWMLRRRRMSGFYLRLNLKMSYKGGKVRSQLKVLITTFPQDAIKASTDATASAATAPGKYIIKRLITAITGSLKSDLNRFLDSR